MKNFVQPGENLTIPAPVAYASGDVVIVGEIVGIAAGDALEDEMVDVATRGVFRLDKVAADAFAVGDAVYFDAATKLVTSTATDNAKIGVAVKVAVDGSSVVEVKL